MQSHRPPKGAVVALVFAGRLRMRLSNDFPPRERNTRLFIFPCHEHGQSKHSLPGLRAAGLGSPPALMRTLAAAWGRSALRGGCGSADRSQQQPEPTVERAMESSHPSLPGSAQPLASVSQPPDLPAVCRSLCRIASSCLCS